MKFIKKNKFTIIAIIIFVGLVIAFYQIKNFLVPDEGKAVYGERLNGLDEHEIDGSVFDNIKSKLKENERILEVTNKIHGKIINLLITVSDDMSVSDAKNIATSTISMFENDELSFYSLQVYLIKDNKDLNNFPIIGYKGPKSSELLFTRDRDIVVSEETDDEE